MLALEQKSFTEVIILCQSIKIFQSGLPKQHTQLYHVAAIANPLEVEKQK